MKRVLDFCCACLLLFSIEGSSQTAKARGSDRLVYRHAYYLFLAGTRRGCEECYVPLLITAEPLEQVARASAKERCVLITTYERDSIWHEDGIVVVAERDLDATSRMVELRGRKYRYQETGADDALRLFMKPMGTIPISRPMLPKAEVPGPSLEELASDFRREK